MFKWLKFCFYDWWVIPWGLFCSRGIRSMPGSRYKKCPFWSKDKEKDEQECGYCSFLKMGDWESSHMSLLWDGVKECGVKTNKGRVYEDLRSLYSLPRKK